MSDTDRWPADLPRFAVIGRSNSGKTTLVSQLVRALCARDVSVGTVKHASHRLDLDIKGKDSWRHGQAGADRVLLIGPGTSVGFVHRNGPEELAGWGRFFQGAVDLVVIEGFKRTPMPHVWVEEADVPEATLTRRDAEAKATPGWLLRRPAGPLDPEVGLPTEIVAQLAESAAGLVTGRER